MNLIIKILLWGSYAVSLYFAVFLFVLLLKNKYVHKKKSAGSLPLVSIAIPAYNEEENILPTLESIAQLDYPKRKLDVIIVNDGSTDNTQAVVEEYIKKRTYMRLVVKTNGGKGSALNTALKLAKGTFFSCLDADSRVEPSALRNMLAMFTKDVAIVTPAMRVNTPVNFIQRIQRAEYILQVLLARLISKIDCQYVAPGPFSIYRTNVLKKLGGFDEHNLTEDQEIAYRHQLHNYKIVHCNEGKVFTTPPSTIRSFYNQRNRWYKGGFTNLLSYRRLILNKEYGDFGVMQMMMNVTRYVLCIIAVILTADIFFWPWLKRLKDLVTIRFDLLPYLNEFTLTWNMASIGITQTFILACMFGISLYLFWTAHKEMNENVFSYGLFVFIPYFFLYYLAKSAIVFIVLMELAIGKRQKW